MCFLQLNIDTGHELFGFRYVDEFQAMLATEPLEEVQSFNSFSFIAM